MQKEVEALKAKLGALAEAHLAGDTSDQSVTIAVPFRSRGTSLNANIFIARLASSAVRDAGISLTGSSPSPANPARMLGGISLSASIALEMAV